MPLNPMHSSDDEQQLISTDGPINRRTALLQQRKLDEAQAHSTPEVLERVLRVHMRNAMGAPLAQQLAAEGSNAPRAPSVLLIGSGVVVASGTVLGLLGVIQSSRLTVLGGVLVGLAGLVAMVWFRRQSDGAVDRTTPARAMFDHSTLDTFDQVLDEAAADLGEVAVQHLTTIKTSIVRIAQHAKGVDEHFTSEDQLYLRECLRRYIPDTLEAYLRIPAGQRRTPLLDGQATAEFTMLRQLSMLADEVAQREKKIGRSAAESLMKQERFLASKKSR
jgi:hypothetical protein